MEDKIYVLQLENGKYYVGKTSDVKKRFEQHAAGKGAEWTKIYKPVKLLETRRVTSEHDENNITKDLMKKYGIENVRGGAHASVNLSPEVEDVLRHEIKSNSDACYKCGKSGHFAKFCKRKSSFHGMCGCGREFFVLEDHLSHMKMCIPRRKKECSRCGRDSHTEEKCYATTDVNGQCIEEDHDDTCNRCGRQGHWAKNCYAYTTETGEYLGKPKRDYRRDWSDDDSE